MTYLYWYIGISLFFSLNACVCVYCMPEFASNDEEAVREVKEATKLNSVKAYLGLISFFFVFAVIWPYFLINAHLRDRKKKKRT